jgi:hypothetical protein
MGRRPSPPRTAAAVQAHWAAVEMGDMLCQLRNVPSYFACTTDKIISEKSGLYDVLIDGSDIVCHDKAIQALIRVCARQQRDCSTSAACQG